jgi:hypothetical protein
VWPRAWLRSIKFRWRVGVLYHYVHGFDTPFLRKKEHNTAFGAYRRMRFNLVRQPVEIIKNCYSLFSVLLLGCLSFFFWGLQSNALSFTTRRSIVHTSVFQLYHNRALNGYPARLHPLYSRNASFPSTGYYFRHSYWIPKCLHDIVSQSIDTSLLKCKLALYSQPVTFVFIWLM